ncbi:MAG: HdeD family acid-resistance protein [Microthrixaceae bacterium]
MAMTETDVVVDARDVRGALKLWWVFLVTGIIWLLIALVVLRFNETSVSTVGLILGVIFLVACLNEFLAFAVLRSGWRWLNLVFGVLLGGAALYSFVNPQSAFWALASVLGLILILAGSFQIISAVLARHTNDVWWLGLIVGILELLLGFWASQQYFPARAALILIWVGFFALFRGITEIVLAFQIHGAGRSLDERYGTA